MKEIAININPGDTEMEQVVGDGSRWDAEIFHVAELVPLGTAGAIQYLRDYLQQLVASGAAVMGITLSKSLDVDRPEDLEAAESFLTTETKR